MAIVSADNVAIQAQGLGALPALRQVGLMVGLALSVALGVTVAMWSQQPNYSMLYGNLSSKELSQITPVLDASQIEYQIDGGSGVIMVAADKLSEARMKLATQGVQVGSDVGYELLEKEQGFGSSSFLQKARYHRAIEGELAKSIGALNGVESARVHLAIPKRSAFARKGAKPAASIVLHLFAGRMIQDAQVAGIINMVASSVPGLEAEQVTVIDHKGRLLSSLSGNTDLMLSSSQFDYSRKLEQRYTQSIIDILTPVVGLGGVRAQVVADIDFTSNEQTRESYLPDARALRSEQLYEQSTDQSETAGIPGALTNQPPAAGTVRTNDDVAANENAASNINNTSRAVRNYELDKTISHTRQSPAKLTRLSVAVVVDYKQSVDGKGNVERTALSEDEIKRVTDLVKESVGLNEVRGDTINIVNIPFQQPEQVEPLPEPAIWEQPWVWTLAKQIIGGLFVLLLAFGVIRPMLTNLTSEGKRVEKLVAERLTADGVVVPQQAGQLPGATAQPGLPDQSQANGQQLMDMASQMAKTNPQKVAQVMNTWVASDE